MVYVYWPVAYVGVLWDAGSCEWWLLLGVMSRKLVSLPRDACVYAAVVVVVPCTCVCCWWWKEDLVIDTDIHTYTLTPTTKHHAEKYLCSLIDLYDKQNNIVGEWWASPRSLGILLEKYLCSVTQKTRIMSIWVMASPHSWDSPRSIFSIFAYRYVMASPPY